MVATVHPTAGQTLHAKVLERWKAYLAKPEESHPFLNRWFRGGQDAQEAESFQRLMLEILSEKKTVDEENRRVVEQAKRTEAKVIRTIVLPGGYRSEEDFNPGAYIQSKSLERDRFVAYNRIFGEKSAPLNFGRELTADLLEEDQRSEYDRLKKKFEDLKKTLPPQYPYLQCADDFEPVDLNLNIRGNPEALGEVVPRRFPAALSGGKLILSAANGGSWASLDSFEAAKSAAETLHTQITAFVANPATALALSTIKEYSSVGSNKPLLQADPTQPTSRTISGVPLYVSPAVANDIVWGVPRQHSLFVLRQGSTVVTDSSVFFTSDRVAVRATLRVSFGFTYPLAAVKITKA